MTRRRLGLVLAAIAMLGLVSLATAAAQSQETFHINVSSARTVGGIGASAADPVELSVPEGTESLRIEADWVEASDPMELGLVEGRCQTHCHRETVAVAEDEPPVTLVVASPNASQLELDVEASDGVAADREVHGTVTYVTEDAPEEDGGERAPASAGSASPQAPSEDGPSASAIAAGAVGLAAATAVARRLLGSPAPLFTLFHRLRDREDLLDHPVRRTIYEHVEDSPGVHFERLARELDLGRGNLDHHLAKLVQADLLQERRIVGYRAYFRPGGVPRRLQEPLVLLKAQGARSLVRQADGRAGVRELARRTGLAPSTVSHHVDRLAEAGLLAVDEEGRGLAVEPTSLAERTLPLVSS